MRRRLAVYGILALVAAGCAQERPANGPFVTTRDSTGGILRIQHTGTAPPWTAAELVTIGSVDDSPSSFARIRSILLGKDDGVLVADAGNKIIREFGPNGIFRRDIGRDGAGPSEYREPYSLAWLGDTLVLLDPINARVGLFQPDRSWAGQWPSPVLTGGSQIRLYPSGDGNLYLMSFTSEGLVFIAHGLMGTTDTLPDLPPRQGLTTSIRCEWPDNGGITFFDVPFSVRRLRIPGPEQTYLVVDTEQYRIMSVTPAGDTIRIIERDATIPVPITDAEWDERTTLFREQRAKYPEMQCPVSRLPRASAKPAIDDFLLADDGTLWVDRWTVDGRVTEVFSPDGDLLGAFPTMERNRNVVPSARGRRIAVVVNDEDGIPFVKIFALQ